MAESPNRGLEAITDWLTDWLRHLVQTDCGAHPASYPVPGALTAGREADYTHLLLVSTLRMYEAKLQ
jgi:hypothetical protein